jgi:dTDP-4-dehydrorhamnose reductase
VEALARIGLPRRASRPQDDLKVAMRLYSIGAEGQLARALREAAAGYPDIVFKAGARPLVDLLRPNSVGRALADFNPDLVINPAAYTAVDKAELEPELAFSINRDGARAVATATANRGIPIIQLSTDYVFDGRKTASYVETDRTSPLGVYGQSKLEGEHAVAASNPRHIVMRTSWAYAPYGNNFVRTMLRLSRQQALLRVVNDQIGCPTYAPDIARSILDVATLVHRSGWQNRFAGVTHLAGPDAMTWFGFARKIIAGAAMRGGRDVTVEPISTAEYPTTAVRPANSRLSTDRLNSVFGVFVPHVDHSLEDCLNRLAHDGELR